MQDGGRLPKLQHLSLMGAQEVRQVIRRSLSYDIPYVSLTGSQLKLMTCRTISQLASTRVSRMPTLKGAWWSSLHPSASGWRTLLKSLWMLLNRRATGPLATLLLQPDRFTGQSAVFIQDSQAAVLALNKGRSEFDELATTIVKACRVVAAYLHCNISAKWIPRRSNR